MNFSIQMLKTRQFWGEMLIIVLGILVGSAAVYYFLMPSKLVLGSLSGLAIVLNEVFASIGLTVKVSTIVLVINAMLLLLAYIFLGAEVGFKTVIASLLLGPFIDIWGMILPYEQLIEPGTTSVMGDQIFDLLAFVLLLGASQAFLFRINASTGGLDIVALIMNKYLHWDIGSSVTAAGMAVCCTAFFIHPFRIAAIGIIGTWFNGIVIDYFTTSLNKRKRVCIISRCYEQIREFIISDLYRGCSLYEVKGGYSGENGVEIQALLTQGEFAKLMEFIRKNDINAFITAGNCSEVYGLWRGHKHGKSSKKKEC